ncbi:group III truncated hemoglobin [Agromyces sp. GXQ0307]|uniref:group III truncated hemoglobin n=1 Tax=Agromyces sp. GXQ0307 TaxID=3377835 RepID=UPI00383B230F
MTRGAGDLGDLTDQRDLRDRDDIARLVREFYARAFDDPLIGPIFTDIAHMDLEHHLPIMCDFWETVVFQTGSYRRNAFTLHEALNRRAPLGDAEFGRWIELWTATVDDLFAGESAERAKVRARRIASSMQRRLAGGSGSALETIVTRERLAAAGGIDEVREAPAR